MAGPVAVKNLREVQVALRDVERDVRLGWRKEVRAAVEPIRADAQAAALDGIRNMPQSPKWARMRTGVTRKVIYVAPRQKGTRGRGPRRRPNLADLLMTRAMEPALGRHQDQVAQQVQQAVDRACAKFNRG